MSNIDLRHLYAVIVLAGELNFTRAADILCISQSALSKRITDLEQEYGFLMFTRSKKLGVEITVAGSVFAEEAKSCIFHLKQAAARGQAAHDSRESVLNVGYSSHADHAWIAAIVAIRLPSYPSLKIRLTSQFCMEPVQSVLSGELSFALVVAPLQDDRITAIPFARTSLYAAIPETHPAAHKERLVLKDLANDPWILFPKRLDPLVYEAIVETAGRLLIVPKHTHDSPTPYQAIELVAENLGVAIFTKPATSNLRSDGVLIKPLCDPSLSFETCVITRTGDNSRLVNEVVQSFLGNYPPRRFAPEQLGLSLVA